jgi:hypothetical protein
LREITERRNRVEWTRNEAFYALRERNEEIEEEKRKIRIREIAEKEIEREKELVKEGDERVAKGMSCRGCRFLENRSTEICCSQREDLDKGFAGRC